MNVVKKTLLFDLGVIVLITACGGGGGRGYTL